MSAPKYRIAPKFLSLLHGRGMDVYNIAAQAGLSVSVAQKALGRHPRSRQQHRAKLAPFLTELELAALGWTTTGELFPVEQSAPCFPEPLSPAVAATAVNQT